LKTVSILYLLVGLLVSGAASSLYAAELTADSLEQNGDGMISASGHVHLQTSDYDIQADSLHVHPDSQAGDMQGATVRFPQGYTLKGDDLERTDLENFKGKNIEYSACPTDDWAWSLVADEAELDREAGLFTAKNVWFEFGGVPVFYTPRWQHALTRRSGFLMPEIGNSSLRGGEVTVPFYWAGAPNWDVTFRPRWMSERGVMSDVEWRHRTASSLESLQLQTISDQQTQTKRGRVLSHWLWQAAPSVRVNMDVDAINKDDGLYVADYPLLGEKESKAYLISTASVGWYEQKDSAVLSSRYQQRLGGTSNDATLQILPRVETRNYFDVGFDSDLVVEHQTSIFDRKAGYSGRRTAIKPSFTVPMSTLAGALSATWSIEGQGVSYATDDSTGTQAAHTTLAALASSFEMQAAFERISSDQTWRHELKPMIRVDISDAPNQSDKPNYDSRLIPLNMSNVLQGNRYSGWDRFERMRRVSFLLSSSLQHKEEQGKSARTLLQGQIGFVWDDALTTVDSTLARQSTRHASNLLAEISWMPFASSTLSMGGQHDPDLNRWVSSHASVGWRGEQQQSLHVSWQRTEASYAKEAETVNLNGRVQLKPRWSSYIAGNYDLLRGYTLNALVGVEYKHACWSLVLEQYQNFRIASNQVEDKGTRFLLAFKGLGSFGD